MHEEEENEEEEEEEVKDKNVERYEADDAIIA